MFPDVLGQSNIYLHPEVRPLTTDPIKAERIELKARACGVSSQPPTYVSEPSEYVGVSDGKFDGKGILDCLVPREI